MAVSAQNKPAVVPLVYRIFFLYIEPLAAMLGAYYAFFEPRDYLRLTDPASTPSVSLPPSTTIVLGQLSNLYLLFAINEALVLRATSDIRVWRTLLFGLLIADLGHLYSVHPLGLQMYWNVFRWNAIDWGNVAFVYAGASTRVLFLAGVGMSEAKAQHHSNYRLKP
ncbi:MAG: hypothetical protein LQ345_002338 [Seirophora villosa]|nr:MAG: hypothetical protein LQ345_002338 [Seirophora villosa]